MRLVDAIDVALKIVALHLRPCQMRAENCCGVYEHRRERSANGVVGDSQDPHNDGQYFTNHDRGKPLQYLAVLVDWQFRVVVSSVPGR